MSNATHAISNYCGDTVIQAAQAKPADNYLRYLTATHPVHSSTKHEQPAQPLPANHQQPWYYVCTYWDDCFDKPSINSEHRMKYFQRQYLFNIFLGRVQARALISGFFCLSVIVSL